MAVFPATIAPSEGMEITTRFTTEIVTARSGREQRRALWATPQHEANLSWPLDSAATVTDSLWSFYVARQGSLESFTFFDFDSTRIWAAANVAMGTTVGGTVAYDLPGKNLGAVHVHIDGTTASGSVSSGTGADGRDQWVFGSNPGAGHVLVAVDFTGQRVFRMRFAEDTYAYTSIGAAVYSTGVRLVEVAE